MHSARNLGFIFDEHLTLSIRSHHFLSPAILISVNSAVSVLTLILKQPVPLLPLLSTLNLTTVTHSTSIFLVNSAVWRVYTEHQKSTLSRPVHVKLLYRIVSYSVRSSVCLSYTIRNSVKTV